MRLPPKHPDYARVGPRHEPTAEVAGIISGPKISVRPLVISQHEKLLKRDVVIRSRIGQHRRRERLFTNRPGSRECNVLGYRSHPWNKSAEKNRTALR